MAVKKVLRLGNPLLRQKSLAIDESEVKTKDFKKLIKDMFETMRFENGIGLAAPQIGILKRIVIVGIEEEFSRDFNGTDFVHGYSYNIVENTFNI